jgi:uncharacterized protein YqeY
MHLEEVSCSQLKDEEIISPVADIYDETGKINFSDGVGEISKELMEEVAAKFDYSNCSAF